MNNRLFHYTNATSLLGIIQNNCLWATNIRFLNDFSELQAGLDFTEDHLFSLVEEGLKNKKIEIDPETISAIKEIINRVLSFTKDNFTKLFNLYVTSFTSRADSAYHWEAYCNQGHGYCIEFDSDKLKKCESNAFTKEAILSVKESPLTIPRTVKISDIEYIQNKSKISNLFGNKIVNAITSMDTEFFNNNENDRDKAALLMERSKDLVMLLSCIKSQDFFHEHESRLIECSYDNYTNSIKFREKKGILTPYKEIDISPNCIKSITIGPSLNFTLAKEGLIRMKKTKNLSFEIIKSNTPYRNF